MSTSPWDPQGTSAFGAAFESFLNQKCSQNEKVVEVRGSQPAHYSPAPPSSEVPPSRRGRKPKPKVNNSMGSSVPAVPIPVEPVRGSGSIETVAEETLKVRRSTTHHHNQKSSSSVAPLASVDSSDFSNFFSPVKVSKEETLAESCEVTKRVNRYLQQVENQTPAPRVWSSLPGTSASLGTSVVEVKKKSNLELIKSETLFVPDQSHQCTLCAKTFASEARLVAHQASHTEPQFPCSKCGKAFKKEASLRFHNCNDLDTSVKRKRRRKEVVEGEKLLVEEGDSFVEANVSFKEGQEHVGEPDIGPIIESIELDVDVVPLQYFVDFQPGVAVESGNLPWLEEVMVEIDDEKTLEEMVAKEQRIFQVVEVVREREQLVVFADVEDQQDLLPTKSLPEWSDEVVSLCGWKQEDVMGIIEGEMRSCAHLNEDSDKPVLFPWQKIPSQWEKDQAAREERLKERKAEEAAEMWKKQALLMGGGPVKDSDSLSQDKAKTKAVIGGERSSSYTSRNSTYFDTSVIQAGSDDDSNEEEWTPEGSAHRKKRKDTAARSSKKQHGKQNPKFKDIRHENKANDKNKSGVGESELKEAVRGERLDKADERTTCEEQATGMDNAGIVETKSGEVAMSTAPKSLILHSTLC